MTARIVGLDIGSASVRAVEVKNPDKPSRMILKTQELPLPEGSVSRGEVIDVSTVSMTIRRLWAMGGFGSKDVVLGMGGFASGPGGVAGPGRAGQRRGGWGG